MSLQKRYTNCKPLQALALTKSDETGNFQDETVTTKPRTKTMFNQGIESCLYVE